MNRQKQAHRIIRVVSEEYKTRYISDKPGRVTYAGGCEFHLFNYIDDETKQKMIDLPRFDENPEYTDEGRPFAMPIRDICPNGKKSNPDDPYPAECGDCVFFQQEQNPPNDIIGICMCEELRLP